LPIVEFKSHMPASQEELFNWHARPGAFERLMPPWQDLVVLERSGGITDGATAVVSVPAGPFRRKLVARHFGYAPPHKFQDEQVSGPFGRWMHTHLCLAGEPAPGQPAGNLPASVLIDKIDYQPPGGMIGRWIAGGLISREIQKMFQFRHRRTRGDLQIQSRHRNAGPICVGISGASGVIGSALRPLLTTAGHRVMALVRRKPDVAAGEIAWDPETGTLDPAALEGVDAFVHLAGENIGDRRWTAERKKGFISSRVDSTRLICKAMTALKRPPRVLVSASAVGFYGDRGDEVLSESSAKGAGFLPDLCDAWERATEGARAAGIRVVNLRIGVVLTRKGGALRKLLTPFKLGLGGVIGSGRQYLSWISTDDVIGSIYESIFNDQLRGPVNATAPTPVTNRQLVKMLGHVLRRPTIIPCPAAAVRLLLGEMGEATALEGAKVLPQSLQTAGYTFRHESVESVLREELGK
jgi:hypothetical protein